MSPMRNDLQRTRRIGGHMCHSADFAQPYLLVGPLDIKRRKEYNHHRDQSKDTLWGVRNMSSEISVSELKRDLSGIINQAAYGKQRIVIGSRGKPKAAMISIEDLHLLESLSQEQSAQAKRMSALGAARVVRADIAARAGGPLPDSTEDLRELREVRTDELASLH